MNPGRFRLTSVFIVQPGRMANRNCVIIGGKIINSRSPISAASPVHSGGSARLYIRRHRFKNCKSNPYCLYSTPSSRSTLLCCTMEQGWCQHETHTLALLQDTCSVIPGITCSSTRISMSVSHLAALRLLQHRNPLLTSAKGAPSPIGTPRHFGIRSNTRAEHFTHVPIHTSHVLPSLHVCLPALRRVGGLCYFQSKCTVT